MVRIVRRLKSFFGIPFSFFKAGHYYSTLPNKDECNSKVLFGYNDININKDAQFKYLQKISSYYKEVFFTEEATPNSPYYFLNRYFSYSDAIILWCLLAQEKPKNIIEVGSGYSTTAILETIKFYNLNTKLLSIDIDFARLNTLISGFNLPDLNTKKSKVQNVELEEFKRLERGDVIFIDSSHVSKKGSDLHFILFEILPQLSSGVIIHFHDVFKNFEYPQAWVDEGIFWNEQYLLRAFLQNNETYEILLFNDFLEHEYNDWYKANMPKCLKVHEKYSVGPQKGKWINDLRGQSLWLVKR